MSTFTEQVIVSESIGWNISDESLRARVFGKLAVLADPHGQMVIHQGDLYHDATWLRENLPLSGLTFYYGVRDSGTSIAKFRDHVSSNTRAYKVTVTRKNTSPRGDPNYEYHVRIAQLVRGAP